MAGKPWSESREEGRFLPTNLEISAIPIIVLGVLFGDRTQTGPIYVSCSEPYLQDNPGRPVEFLAS